MNHNSSLRTMVFHASMLSAVTKFGSLVFGHLSIIFSLVNLVNLLFILLGLVKPVQFEFYVNQHIKISSGIVLVTMQKFCVSRISSIDTCQSEFGYQRCTQSPYSSWSWFPRILLHPPTISGQTYFCVVCCCEWPLTLPLIFAASANTVPPFFVVGPPICRYLLLIIYLTLYSSFCIALAWGSIHFLTWQQPFSFARYMYITLSDLFKVCYSWPLQGFGSYLKVLHGKMYAPLCAHFADFPSLLAWQYVIASKSFVLII